MSLKEILNQHLNETEFSHVRVSVAILFLYVAVLLTFKDVFALLG